MLENKDLKILAGVDTVTVHAGLAGACGGITGVDNISQQCQRLKYSPKEKYRI